MKKPDSLRAALKASLGPRHALATDPDNLQVVITNGRPACSMAPGTSFEFRYQLDLTFLNFAGDFLEIQIPLMLWLQRWQSDLLSSPEAATQGVRITVIPLDDDTSDIQIELQLTERIAFRPRPDGGHDIAYAEEPMPFALDEVDAEPLHAVFLDGELIARCKAHPDQGL